MDSSHHGKLDSEQKFWVVIWSIIAFSVGVIIAAVMVCNNIDDGRIVDLIKHGTDPGKAYCVIHSGATSCVAILVK